MSPRTPWALAALCAGLAGLLLALEALRPSPAVLSRAALLPIGAAQVRRIEARWGETRAVLGRDAEGWWMETGGRRIRADERAVDAALAEIEILSRGGLVPGAAPGAAHGLASPRLSLRLEGDRQNVAIAFGSAAGPGRVYAESLGQLHVVPARAADRWGSGPADLADTRLVRLDPGTLREVQVDGAHLFRRGRRWVLQRPLGARADPDAVRALVAAIASLHVTGQGEPIDVQVADGRGTRRARSRVRAEALARVRGILERLPARRPVHIPGADLEALEIAAGDRRLRIVRTDDRWVLPGGVHAEDDRVGDLLGALARLEAREIHGPEAASRAEPVERTIAWEARGEREELRIGPARGDRRAARFAGEEATYVFADGDWARADPDPLAWRRRVAWDLPPAAVEALALGDAEVRRDDAFRWTRVRPAGAPLDRARVEKLARALAAPRVVRFLRNAPSPGATTKLRVETIDGERRTWHEIEVGGPAPGGGRFARGGGTWMVLDGALWREATEVLLFSR